MAKDNSDIESTGNDSENQHETEAEDPNGPLTSRRGALTLLGLTGLVAVTGQSTAKPPTKPSAESWHQDRDAAGNSLYNLRALTMGANSEEVTDLEGDGLKIIDHELTIDSDALPGDLADHLRAAGRYLEVDEEENELNFTGAAEWENTPDVALNVASGTCAVVAGGMRNDAEGEHAAVGGGERNRADGDSSTVAGGGDNSARGTGATIAGGEDNSANGKFAAVGGGTEVAASGESAVGAGGLIIDANGDFSAVGGGRENGAFGFAATVPGGSNNEASGRYSVAAGRTANANHDGAFVVGNSTGDETESENVDEVRFQAGGGFVIEDLNSGDEVPLTYDSETGEVLVDHSSARYKENIEPLPTDPEAVLGLEPRSFEYTDSGRDGIGLIAEEVAERVPELAVTDSEGRPDAVRYDRLGLYLIPELRRQREENAELRERITALEEHVDGTPVASDDDRGEENN